MEILHSIKIPAPVARGAPVKAEDYNTLLAALKSCICAARASQTASSADIGVRKSESGGQLLYLKKPTGASSSAPRQPWQPAFFTEESVNKCRFNLGTVNNIPAANWDAAFTLPSDDSTKFVIVTVTTASGKVTGIALSVDTSAPAEDSIAKDTPPTTFKIVLGAIGKSSAKMIVTTNLEAVATEVFREPKAAITAGAEPFSRWWRWTLGTLELGYY